MVHYTSHLVHLRDLENAHAQREDFASVAARNAPWMTARPYGRMDKAPTAAEIARAMSQHDATRRPRAVVIELPQRMNGGATMSLEDLQ